MAPSRQIPGCHVNLGRRIVDHLSIYSNIPCGLIKKLPEHSAKAKYDKQADKMKNKNWNINKTC